MSPLWRPLAMLAFSSILSQSGIMIAHGGRSHGKWKRQWDCFLWGLIFVAFQHLSAIHRWEPVENRSEISYLKLLEGLKLLSTTTKIRARLENSQNVLKMFDGVPMGFECGKLWFAMIITRHYRDGRFWQGNRLLHCGSGWLFDFTTGLSSEFFGCAESGSLATVIRRGCQKYERKIFRTVLIIPCVTLAHRAAKWQVAVSS